MENPERHTLLREQLVQVDGKYADGVLGDFRPGDRNFIVVIEGKGPKDPLERPYGGRRLSAVEQGYQYATNLPCDWIIVTSMRETRLYYKGANQYTCESFDILKLAADEGQLRKFVYLLGAERVVPASGRCHLYDLLAASEMADRNVTREFYEKYSKLRYNVFNGLCRANPEEEKGKVLSATQTLLDRILFCAFSEDRGLLPAESIKKAYSHRNPYNPGPVWDNFKGLFRSVNEGSDLLNIPKYNGGLFAANPALDGLTVTDEICRQIKDLGEYDYRALEAVDLSGPAAAGHVVDVEILGHIFEQSITDLERLRNEIEGRTEPEEAKKANGRRKKEGAFYTPAFITRHIVEQTLGRVIRERLEALRQKYAAEAKGTARQALEHPEVYDTDTLKKTQRDALIDFWTAWQDELSRLRIVDPACGSGAFLIEAFDQLHGAYREVNQRLEELKGHEDFLDLNRQILQQNLYGVDLNEEAVEICRLSLWIKTAERGKILTDLEHTIRVGNSVVDDPLVHPKAFNWREAFPEVFADGGFDVVIGNPPYIRQEWIAPYKSFWARRFQSYHGVADIFVFFYELGVELLRTGGRMGFITSGSWVRGNFGGPLRKFLASQAHLESMVDFGEYQPFEDAEMIRPSIVIISKNAPGGSMKLFRWLSKGKPPEDLSECIESAEMVTTEHLEDNDEWNLESHSISQLMDKLSVHGMRLSDYIPTPIYSGIKTGLTEIFVITGEVKDSLVKSHPECINILRPFLRGQDLKPWHYEFSNLWLITLKSSYDHAWPWSISGEDAEKVFAETYPSIYEYLSRSKDALVKRQDKIKFWWELRCCDYWKAFEQDKIVWPDISKLPRFSMDNANHYLGNTGYFIPQGDYFLLGILSSWATWFFISKTTQPLRLRGDRWQYRLFSQYTENIPIPSAEPETRNVIADLARKCNELSNQTYQYQEQFRQRLMQTFAGRSADPTQAKLNNKATAWWDGSFMELGDALAASFKLKANPFRNPRTADEWEPYAKEKRAEVERMNRELADAEGELNERVYRLFDLTPEEIRILQKEVEH